MAAPARSRALAVALLLAVPLAVLAPTLAGPRVLGGVHRAQLSPWAAGTPAPLATQLRDAGWPLASDRALMFEPQLGVALARLARGEAPLWNPDSLCGAPLLGQAVHGALSPLNWLTRLLDPARAFGWIALLQAWIAGLGLYALARELGLPRAAAVLGGLAFALCGYFATRWCWYQIQGASIWLPWALLAVERLARGAGWGACALLGSSVGLSLLAGFPQGSLILLYAAGALTLVRLGPALLGERERRARATGAAARAALGVVLGLALAWPQLGPSIEVATSGDTTRPPVTPQLVATLGAAPATLLTALAPDAFGEPADLARHPHAQLRARGALAHLALKPTANHVESASGFGLVALLLACGGLLAGGARGLRFYAVLGALGALLSIDTPLLPAVLHLPGLSTGDPRRFVLLFACGGALLAGAGLARVLGGRRLPGGLVAALLVALTAACARALLAAAGPEGWVGFVVPRLAAVLGASLPEVAAHAAALDFDRVLLLVALDRVLLFSSLTGLLLLLAPRRPAPAAALLLLAAALDLAHGARAGRPLVPRDGYDAPPPSLASLVDPQGGRLVRFTAGEARDALSLPLPPNLGLGFGIRDLSGYITLGPRRVEALHELLQPGTASGVGTAALSQPGALRSPLLDLFAVSRVLSDVPLSEPHLAPLPAPPGVYAYRNERARPRAWLARHVRFVEDEAGALAALAAPDAGDGVRSETAVLETGADAPKLGGDAERRALDPGTARIVAETPERVELEVEARTDGVLVLADAWMSGWSASIDGRPARALPANLAFRGVLVPAGSHRVVFSFRSPAWEAGLLSAPLALLGLLACAAAARRGARAQPSAAC